MSVETIEYRGFEIEIHHDQAAANPWTVWDCEPPVIVLGDRDWVQCYGIDLAVPELTREQIKANIEDIKTETGSRSLLNLIDEYAGSYLSNYINGPEAINEALYNYADSLSKSDRLEFLAAVYTWQGIPALCTSRHGYCQGDYIELLIVATPEWSERVGTPADLSAHDLEGSADLFGFWAFGDVYGYTVETEAGDLVGSVWGYYGPDHEENGLLENARNDIDCYIDQQRKAKAETVKKWIRGRVPLVYRHADPALNV